MVSVSSGESASLSIRASVLLQKKSTRSVRSAAVRFSSEKFRRRIHEDNGAPTQTLASSKTQNSDPDIIYTGLAKLVHATDFDSVF